MPNFKVMFLSEIEDDSAEQALKSILTLLKTGSLYEMYVQNEEGEIKRYDVVNHITAYEQTTMEEVGTGH